MEPLEPFLDAVTQRLVRQAHEFDPQIVPYAQHALNSNGKHLRPTLVALAAGSIGKISDAHVTAAVIIEMVHLATLDPRRCDGRGGNPPRPVDARGELGK